MRRILTYIRRLMHRPPIPKQQTAREKDLERQWADLLRYEGRPLYGDDQD